MVINVFFFFQAEDGIRGAQESRGLGDVYRRQILGAAKKRTSKSAGPTKKPPAKKFKYSTKPIISAPKHHTPGCKGCRMVPCENMLSLALLHQKLKTSHYKLASYEGVDGNNRRRRHFYYEWKKDHDGKVNPCALDFARSIFPRTEKLARWISFPL